MAATARTRRNPVPGFHTRWAEPSDRSQIRELSTGIFDPGTPLETSWITHTVDDVFGGHPQVDPANYAVAVEDGTDRLIGAAVLFEQPWKIGATTFSAGRPELVVTSPSHRGHGVMRAVLELLHQRSRELGQTAQCITGVPSVYRHLGYSYTHPLTAGREITGLSEHLTRIRRPIRPNLTFAEATRGDVAEVQDLLARGSRDVDVSTPQTTRYTEFTATRQDPASRRGSRTITCRDDSGSLQAVFQIDRSPDSHARTVTAAAIDERADPLCVTEAILRELVARLGATDAGRDSMVLALGDDHVLYQAVMALGIPQVPYQLDRWYFRVESPTRWLEKLRNELNERLRFSVFRHHSGTLSVDAYGTTAALTITDGVVTAIRDSDADAVSGECRIRVAPDQLVTLLIGSRSVDELAAATPETRATNATAHELTRVLFPKLRSRTVPLN